MQRRWWGLVAAAGGGLLAAVASWLAVEPVEGCFLLMSLPPQGACESRLGTTTTLGPGQSAIPFALLTGAGAAGLAWALTLGPARRRRAIMAAVVAIAVAVVTMPAACEWVIPAGQMLHPMTLARECTSPVRVATPVTRPQDAAVWSIAAGIVLVMVAWLLDRLARSRRPTRAP